ncbi:MAG: hypothetical protein PHC46_04515 [Clostridia bacterium]|nr:hypothetical protein [Clostridia bacterium]
MAIFKIRNSARKNYTIVDNFCLQDSNLSYAETGLMAYLLHLPTDWEINQRHIESAKTDGRDKVRNLFKSLIKKGYLVKKDARDECGKFAVEYDVYERPTQVNFEVIHSQVNRDGFTDTAQPTTVNRPQLNTNTKLVNNNINNTNTAPVCEAKTTKRTRIELFEIITKRYAELLAWVIEPKQQEVANEVINIMVDLIYHAEHQGFYKANHKHYTKEEVAKLLVKLDDDSVRSVISSLVFNPKPGEIKDRNRYILAALLKQAEASCKKATNDQQLLELDNYLPNYLEGGA